MATQVSTLDPSEGVPLKRLGITLFVFAVIAAAASVGNLHEPDSPYGWLSLLPTGIVLAVALLTHRTVEALFTGAIIGLLMIDPGQIVPAVVDMSMTVMMDETIAWLILVCGLMGGLITILEKGLFRDNCG